MRNLVRAAVERWLPEGALEAAKVAEQSEIEGLRALADVIEGLPLVRRGDWHPGPVPAIRSLDDRTACIGFTLHAGGSGYGLVAYSPRHRAGR